MTPLHSQTTTILANAIRKDLRTSAPAQSVHRSSMYFQTSLASLRYYMQAAIRLESVLRGASITGLRIPLISDHFETPSLYEQVVVGLLVRVLKPKRCFEIGTSLGLTTNILAMNSDADCQIDTLDVSSESRIGSAFRGTQGAAKIRQHIASSLNFRFDAYKGQMDLIFVDGSHEVQDVVRDTQHSISMLSSKGVALWHDVSPDSPGVVKALEASASLGKFWRISDTSLGLYTKVNSLEDLWQA